MNYRWTFKESADENTIQNLTESLNIPKTLSKVLVGRGIKSKIEAKKFFEPLLESLYDPFLMKDMDIAVDRILLAIDKKEKIWLHGDYDVDGTSSTAVLLQFFKDIGLEVSYFIPDRFQDGYGLSFKSIDLAVKFGASLLVTVDVGITAYDQAKYAKKAGLETIICDHHEPGDLLPDVLALLDPIRPGCDYPFKHLAACGVAFKLIQGICIKMNKIEMAYNYLDYVAIASAADMVPLVDENRIIVSFGLNLINSNPRPGLKGLLHCTRLKEGSINASNIVFAIAPIINAAGRMGDAVRSVEMMIQDNEVSAFRIAQQLEEENRRRRGFDTQTFEEAIPIAEALISEGRKSLVIHRNHWHAGVIGIVASRLVDKFQLPTVLMTSIGGYAKGSARSIKDFDVHSALKASAHLMTEYGGHRYAAGLTMPEKNVDEFRNIFDNLAAKKLEGESTIQEILIDSELQLNELSPNFLNTLNKFAPYGYDNYKPVFYTKGVVSSNGVKIIGNNNLKFRALQNNFVIDAIGYGLADRYDICISGRPFSIVYNLELTNYSGLSSPQLVIKDIKFE